MSNIHYHMSTSWLNRKCISHENISSFGRASLLFYKMYGMNRECVQAQWWRKWFLRFYSFGYISANWKYNYILLVLKEWDLCFIWYYSPTERNYVTYIGNVMTVDDLALRINVVEVSRFNNEKIKIVWVGLYLPDNIAWRQIFLWSFQSVILPATSDILRFSYIQRPIARRNIMDSFSESILLILYSPEIFR